MVRLLLWVSPQVFVQQLQHLLLIKPLLLHVLPELGSVTVHQVHSLIMDIHIKHLPLINVRRSVTLVNIVRHMSLPCGKLRYQVPLFESGVSKTNESSFCNTLSVLGLKVGIAQASQFGSLFFLHAQQLLPVQSGQLLGVLLKCGASLSLLV